MKRSLGLLLKAYPPRFRRRYEDELALVYEHQRHETAYRGLVGALRFWCEVVAEVAWGAGRQWFFLAFGDREIRRFESETAGWRSATTQHTTSGRNIMDELLQDFRYAFSTLSKSPSWTLAAALTLALGLGSTTAVFSVIKNVLLRPLPYEEAERLQVVKDGKPEQGKVYRAVSYPTWGIYRDASTAFESLEAWGFVTVPFQLADGAETVPGLVASSGLFSTLGVHPAQGRDFVPEDDLPESVPVVILSDRLWRGRFNGEPMVGRTVTIEEEPYTVVGVMPHGFRFPDERTLFWLPMRIAPRGEETFYLRMLGRLAEGVGEDEARARLEARRFDVPNGAPGEVHETGLTTRSLYEETVGEVRPQLLLFLAAVAAVLLIATLNVANLMLSRALGREREIALRAALGAGRARLFRQFVAEGLVLAAGGGVLGIAFAASLVNVLIGMSASSLPRVAELGLDTGALVFALALIAVVGIAVALIPAWRATRIDLQAGLQAGTRGAAGHQGPSRLRHGMIVVQLALTLVLLVGATLLLKSFAALLASESGFDRDNVLIASLELPGERYEDLGRQQAFYDELLPRLEGLPGVRSASVSSSHPFRLRSHQRIAPEDQESDADARTTTYSYWVSSDHFAVMGMTTLAGRLFEDHDGQENTAIVLSESLAHRLFPDGNAVGHRVRLGAREPQTREVIGVVADLRQYSLSRADSGWTGQDGGRVLPMAFVPYSAASSPYALTVLIRTATAPWQLTGPVRQVVGKVDAHVPMRLSTLESDLEASVAAPRFRVLVLGSFGAAALLLAMVGLYGVMAHWVGQRAPELGVRMALGADRGRILRQVVARGGVLTLVGLGIGLLAALPAVHLVERYLFELEAVDPVSFLVAFSGLFGAALLACLVPALKASRLDPVAVLRGE